MSGAVASYEGRDIGQAMVEGSMEGAFASATNTLVGHAVGVLLAGSGEGRWYTDSQGRQAYLYLHGHGMGAITFGNVIIGDAGFLGGRAANGEGYLNLDHEMSHVQQGMTLSVGYVYLPNARNFWEFLGAHPWSLATSEVLSGGSSSHRYDALECYWNAVPDCQ
jgi:hypothetical protein